MGIPWVGAVPADQAPYFARRAPDSEGVGVEKAGLWGRTAAVARLGAPVPMLKNGPDPMLKNKESTMTSLRTNALMAACLAATALLHTAPVQAQSTRDNIRMIE